MARKYSQTVNTTHLNWLAISKHQSLGLGDSRKVDTRELREEFTPLINLPIVYVLKKAFSNFFCWCFWCTLASNFGFFLKILKPAIQKKNIFGGLASYFFFFGPPKTAPLGKSLCIAEICAVILERMKTEKLSKILQSK